MRCLFRRQGTIGNVLFACVVLVLLLAALCLYAAGNPGMRARMLDWRLAGMKNADYASTIGGLMKEERYEEAEKLAAFVAAHPDMPAQEKVRGLREEIARISRRQRSPLERGLDLLSGFLSGGGGSSEEILGGLFSNILISNKGLSEDALPKRTQDDSNRLAELLEGAHLGLDGRWFPAVMRTLRMSDLMSPAYESFLMANAEESARNGAPTAALAAAVSDTRKLVSTLGMSRVLGLHRIVRDGRNLRQLADWGKLSPDKTYIVAMQGGLDVLPKLPAPPQGTDLLLEIAKKGRAAIDSADFWLDRQ